MEETTTLVNDTIIAHVRQIDDNITTLTALMVILLVVGASYLINKIFNNETIRTVWDKDDEKYYGKSGVASGKDFPVPNFCYQKKWKKDRVL